MNMSVKKLSKFLVMQFFFGMPFTFELISPPDLVSSSPSLFLVRQLQEVTMGMWSGHTMSRLKALK